MTCKDSCNKCGQKHDPCAGSHAQRRKFTGDLLPVGTRHVIMTHGKCCCTSCRRVTLWHPRPAFPEGAEDDWAVKAIARVTWGDGCDGPEVEVDWKHGVILDLSGCWDQVVLEIIENTGPGGGADEDIEFTFGALSACCGAGAARGCATRTTATFTTEVEEITVIPIPPFAYAVMFAPHGDITDFFIATTSVSQSGSGSGNVLLSVTGDNIPSDGWTLIGGAESILVSVAEEGTEAIEYEVVFLIGV